MMKCRFCGTPNRDGETLCVQCGKLIGEIPNRRVCSYCGREIPVDRDDCLYCKKRSPVSKMSYAIIAVIVSIVVVATYVYVSHYYIVDGDKNWAFWKPK